MAYRREWLGRSMRRCAALITPPVGCAAMVRLPSVCCSFCGSAARTACAAGGGGRRGFAPHVGLALHEALESIVEARHCLSMTALLTICKPNLTGPGIAVHRTWDHRA